MLSHYSHIHTTSGHSGREREREIDKEREREREKERERRGESGERGGRNDIRLDLNPLLGRLNQHMWSPHI